MTWDDVDEILFDGTKEQILAVKCPECGGDLVFSYFKETRGRETGCLGCHTFSRGYRAYKVPNFFKFGITGTQTRNEALPD